MPTLSFPFIPPGTHAVCVGLRRFSEKSALPRRMRKGTFWLGSEGHSLSVEQRKKGEQQGGHPKGEKNDQDHGEGQIDLGVDPAALHQHPEAVRCADDHQVADQVGQHIVPQAWGGQQDQPEQEAACGIEQQTEKEGIVSFGGEEFPSFPCQQSFFRHW